MYSNEEDMCSFVIDGEEYVEDEERAIIPKAVLKQIYYDESNNYRKFWVDDSKQQFNTDYTADFVLAGW